MSVFIGGPYGRLAVMLNKSSSLNIEIIIVAQLTSHHLQTVRKKSQIIIIVDDSSEDRMQD